MTVANAYVERFVRTIKESCLERMILFGESAVGKATAEFMAHYHSERRDCWWTIQPGN
jgi:replication-associated recombination protein RarA